MRALLIILKICYVYWGPLEAQSTLEQRKQLRNLHFNDYIIPFFIFSFFLFSNSFLANLFDFRRKTLFLQRFKGRFNQPENLVGLKIIASGHARN